MRVQHCPDCDGILGYLNTADDSQQRGIPAEEAVGLIVNGYAKEVMNKLPMEFAVEAQKLLQINLEGSVG